MKLNKNEQVILVSTKDYHINEGLLKLYEKKKKWKLVLTTQSYIGKSGFTDMKKEGDQKRPTGKYTINSTFGYLGNPGTKLNFKNASMYDVWVDYPHSKFYNTWKQTNKLYTNLLSSEVITHRLSIYGNIFTYS